MSRQSTRNHWVTKRHDARTLALLLILLPFAWLVPVRHWPGVGRLLTGLTRSRARAQVNLARDAPGYDDAVARTQQRRTSIFESRMQYLREYWPGGWQVPIAVEGLGHVEAARSRDHGVILWVAYQDFASLVVKKGLCQTGLAVHHLSAPAHGLSSSRLGIKYLNPIVTRIEDRYLAERIPYHENRSARAVAAMQRRLRDGLVLSITAGVGRRSTVPVPVGDGDLVFPVSLGPLKLARKTGAALLPCYISRARDRSFTVHITPPLDLTSVEDPVAAAAIALRELSERLSPAIAAQPELWRCRPASEDNAAASRSDI